MLPAQWRQVGQQAVVLISSVPQACTTTWQFLVEAAHPDLADAMTVHPVCQEEPYNPGRDVSINPNKDSILTPWSKIMRGEAVGEARRHLAQLDPLLFEPGEKAPHGLGIGAAGVGVGEAGREELVGGEDCILPGALYRTITTFIVLYTGRGRPPTRRWCGEQSRS